MSPEVLTQGGCLATFWQQLSQATTYWRCHVPARHLPGQSLALNPEDLEEKNGLVTMPRQKGRAAVWQFIGDPIRAPMAFFLQEQGVWTSLEVDDNYMRPAPHFRPWAKTIKDSKNAQITGYSHEAHVQILPHFNSIIVSTPHLARLYGDYNDNVVICPNSIDPADWEYDRPIDDGILRIVYSGSPSHTVDAPQIKKAFKWAARQPNVQVYLQGFDMPWGFVEKDPWTKNLQTHRESLFQFDVGVCPIVDTPFSRSKSDVKALEYAMAGVMPLVSRTEPYRPWFRMKDLVVEPNENAWIDKLKWVVKNRDEVKHLAEIAKNYTLGARTIQDNIWLWREAIGQGEQAS